MTYVKNGLYKIWSKSKLNSSYWFIPSLMTVGVILLSIASVRVDTSLGPDWMRGISWLYSNEPAGSRALLSTIAGSMITVAGVTFSMTLLSFSHVSSQIGLRILNGFIEDRGNQITLGTFITTLVFFLLTCSKNGSK